MKKTIVEKIKELLKIKTSLTLKELYELLPEHPKASIRGNLNRYVSKKKDIARIKKATYAISHDIKIERINEEKSLVTSVGEFKVLNFPVRKIKNEILLSNEQMDFLSELNNIAVGESRSLHFEKTYDNGFLKDTKEFIKDIVKPNNLYHGDALELMSKMKECSVDLIITDPPYKGISGGRNSSKNQPSGILSKNDGKIFTHNDVKIEDFMPLLYKVLKEDSHAYIMTNTLNLEKMLTVARKVGFKLHNLLAWEKNNATPNAFYMKNCEYTLFLRKGKAKPINYMGSKTIHQFKNIIGKKLHPTEKPMELIKFYMENSLDKSKEQIVFDPFMGAGVVPAVATILGRLFIGIELDFKYFKIAKTRLENILKFGDEKRELLLNLL